MVDSDSHEKPDIPEVPDSGSTGEQNAPPIEGEIIAPVTDVPYATGEFVGALDKHNQTRSRGISGSGMSNLVVARLRELERQNQDIQARNAELASKLDAKKGELASYQVELAVEKKNTESSAVISRLSAVFLVVAGLLLTLAFVPDLSDVGAGNWVLMVAALILYLVGIFGPTIFRKRASK